MKQLLFLFLLILFVQACATKKVTPLLQENANNYFSGLVLYNPMTKDTLISYNAEKYFTPASTVKLFTLYVSLKSLQDSIATISYYETENSLYFKPLADPSFLHDSLPNTTFNFLKNTNKELLIHQEPFEDFIYGDGWQWDDFQYYYMPEKSVFPIYANMALLHNNTRLMPSRFNENLKEFDSLKFHRDFDGNLFYKDKKKRELRKIPFKTSFELARTLLSDTLQKPIYISEKIENKRYKPYISTPLHPIYKRLMDESENFIAEQLFLIISKEKTNHYKVKNTISYALDSLLYDIPNIPRWVDASGLSRYNIFTPKSMVYLLDKLYTDFGEEVTFELMPKNGENGKLQKWYPYESTYLYAKTGSLSNNHNICGYMKTKKGTLLVFSYMNNNFIDKTSDVRVFMNKTLQEIYNTY